MFDFDPPSDKRSILKVLERLDGEIADYLGGLSVDEFLAPQGDAWSPCGHLVHLNKSVGAVTRALRVPRLLLGLRFGWSRSGSEDFAAVCRRYRAALDGGLQAGPYGPSDRPPGLPPDALRGRVLGRWRRLDGELRGALERWSEEALDRYRLPHPALGRMTVREVLFFTAYHNAHHARRVAERRAAGGR